MCVDWSGEFERRHNIDRVTTTPVLIQIMAGSNECAAVAKRLDLQEIASLEADCRLDRPVDGDDIRLRGRLQASVTQTCVVTLEPLPVRISAAFERLYVRDWTPTMDADGEMVDPEAPDIEPLIGDSVDLGEVVVEELSLALDPFPRGPEAEVVWPEEAVPPGPFDALRVLRRP